MKTLKEMKAAMTASEMNLVKGGVNEVAAINPTLIAEAAGIGVKTVSADCRPATMPGDLNCRTLVGKISWFIGIVLTNDAPPTKF